MPTKKKPAKDSRAKLTPKERAKALPPDTEADAAEFEAVLRRLVETPPPKKARA